MIVLNNQYGRMIILNYLKQNNLVYTSKKREFELNKMWNDHRYDLVFILLYIYITLAIIYKWNYYHY